MARRCLAVILLLLAAMPAVAWATASAVQSSGFWYLETPLGTVDGACWIIRDPARGAWRLEVVVSTGEAASSGSDLKQRRGEGWTLCSTGDAAFSQRWHHPWTQPGAETASMLAELVTTGSDSARNPLRLVLRSLAGLPEAWRPPGGHAVQGGALRRQLVIRGLGRGGPGLVIRGRWLGDALELSSSRWPGRLVIELLVATPVVDVPPETFLPIWSLADLGF